MFRDYKSGGYYLEGTALKGQRVMTLIYYSGSPESEVCPMPNAQCPMPNARRVPHVTEKG